MQVDKRPMFAWSGLSNADSFPHSWHPNWGDPKLTADQLTANLLEVMLPAIEDRILLWQVGGRDPKIANGFLTFASWHVLSDAQKAALATAIKTWKSVKPGRKVCMYSGWTTDPFTREVKGYGQGEDRWWHQQMGPLVGIGVDEVCLDAGADPQFPGLAHVTKLLCDHYGVRTLIEAIPLTGTGQPDPKRIGLNAAVCWWQFLQPYDWKNWPIIPASLEVHVFGAPASEYKALTDRGLICGTAA